MGWQYVTIRSGVGDVRQIRNARAAFCWRLPYILHKPDAFNRIIFVRDCARFFEALLSGNDLPTPHLRVVFVLVSSHAARYGA